MSFPIYIFQTVYLTGKLEPGTLVGPQKNWKTGTRDPNGTLAGRYKNQKSALVGR